MPDQNIALRPTLLVGVGGTGCEIADRVFNIAVREGLSDNRRLSILGFDTDDNDIKRHRHLSSQQLIRTSTNHTVYQILDFHAAALQRWFAEDEDLTTEIRQMHLMDGAGQIRMMSRLAFQTAMEDVHTVSRLENALNALTAHDGQTVFEGQINVTLVGSLAGGTGAGMFLQTALLLAALLRDKAITPELRGLFLLPDVFVHAAKLPAGQVSNVYANGYAALRELNAIMLQTAERSPLPVEFEFVRGRRLLKDGLPFKSIVLLDYENANGGNLGSNFPAYKDMAARAAYNLLFTPLGGRYTSIAINDVRQKVEAAGNGDMNYYAGVGVAEAVYPDEDILDYLALRYGQLLLAGDWRRLDELYLQEVSQYRQRLHNGETNLKPPVRGDAYCRNLAQLATQEKIRFFRELYEKVHVREEDQRGNVRIDHQYEVYLNALEKHAKGSFWDSNAKLRQARHHPGLDSNTLTDKQALSNDVLTLERELRSYLESIERAIDEEPHRLFASVVLSADQLGEKEWKSYHLPAYLVKNGPHPVQARYFLYHLLQQIDERRAKLDEHVHRSTLDKLKLRFDDPNTPGEELAREIADQISQSGLPTWLDGKFKRFTQDYREYFNDSLKQLVSYAEESLLRRLYERIERYVKELLAVLEGFFNDLGDLENDLTLERNQLEVRHQEGAGISAGIRYVLASAEAKQALWADLQDRLGADTGDQQAKINAAITQALYQQHRDRQTASRWQSVPELDSKTLFREKILQGFCRGDIQANHANVYRLNWVEAVRRESVLNNRDFTELLQEIKKLVAYQAAPYLAVGNTAAGQTIRLWAVSPVLKAALSNDELYSRLFADTPGESPVEQEVFPADRLVCLNTQVNLTLRDLRKLHPGSDSDQVGAAQPGRYYQAYRAMLDRILADKQVNPDQPARDFTPHLDRHWDKPGVLPEIFPQLGQAAQAQFMDGYLLGIALGLLVWDERDGERVALYRDWDKRGTPQAERILHRGFDDDLALLKVLRTNPEIPAGIINRANEIREKRLSADNLPVSDPKQTPLYQGLRHPQTLERVVRLSANRDPAVKADEQTSQATEALFRQFRAYVEATLTELHPRQQRRLVEDELEEQAKAALEILRAGPKPLAEETLRIVTELINGGLDRLYQ
jgi:hypothetical protein